MSGCVFCSTGVMQVSPWLKDAVMEQQFQQCFEQPLSEAFCGLVSFLYRRRTRYTLDTVVESLLTGGFQT